MKKGLLLFLLLALFLACAPGSALCEEDEKEPNADHAHYGTTLPAEARYEVVQSGIAPRWTFRLDRFTGRVYKLGQLDSGEIAWEQMLVWEPPKIDDPSKPRFQLLLSGFSAGVFLLLDTFTGRTWRMDVRELKIKKKETAVITGWFPVKELTEIEKEEEKRPK